MLVHFAEQSLAGDVQAAGCLVFVDFLFSAGISF